MERITVCASGKYDILIECGLLREVGRLISELSVHTVMLVSDDTVYGLYGGYVTDLLLKHGITVHSFIIPHGESSKSTENLVALWESMAAAGMTRNDAAVALGGGVVGDITGFAAATYQRGIRYISVPTTLLAMVDSSVGGKTAVNLHAGKNLAGAFWQPSLVITDPEILTSLPAERVSDGMAEVIKYGMINRPELFKEEGPAEIIKICIDDKRRIVEQDEHDTGVRQLLNLGHTLGHAAEKLSNFKMMHGFAVAGGMAIITRAAVGLGLCERAAVPVLEEALTKNGLPISLPYTAQQLAAAAQGDKKRSGDGIMLVIPHAIGRCELHPTPLCKLADIIKMGEL